MRGKRVSEEIMVKTIKRLDGGERIKDLARVLGVAEQTIYAWKSKYSGMEVNDVKEMRRPQDENAKLKRLVADQALDIIMLKDINSRKW
jgi:putative transposase